MRPPVPVGKDWPVAVQAKFKAPAIHPEGRTRLFVSPTPQGPRSPKKSSGSFAAVGQRRDSGLEAFSRSPTEGSVAPSAFRPSTRTSVPHLRFLSYWAGVLSRPRPALARRRPPAKRNARRAKVPSCHTFFRG